MKIQYIPTAKTMDTRDRFERLTKDRIDNYIFKLYVATLCWWLLAHREEYKIPRGTQLNEVNGMMNFPVRYGWFSLRSLAELDEPPEMEDVVAALREQSQMVNKYLYDEDMIFAAADTGATVREVADMVGCSKSTAHSKIKARREKQQAIAAAGLDEKDVEFIKEIGDYLKQIKDKLHI